MIEINGLTGSDYGCLKVAKMIDALQAGAYCGRITIAFLTNSVLCYRDAGDLHSFFPVGIE
jgi:hypothetical protein